MCWRDRSRTSMTEGTLHATMASIERRGPWRVPPHLECRVRMGNIELDLREAELAAETTIAVNIAFGNLEIIVPHHGIAVDLAVSSVAGNVEDWRPGGGSEPTAKRLRITGKVK